MLHVFLALDCIPRGRKHFEIDEPMDVKSFGVTFDKAITMLVDPSDEIARDADVDCTAGSACKDVQIELAHAPSLPKRDGRDKPGHDG